MTKSIHKLAIVGASARAAAFSALRAGFEVEAADFFADADLQRVCPVKRISGYPDAVAEWLAETECDAWLYTGGMENHPELVDSLASLRPLLGNDGDSLRAVRDPLALQEALASAGLQFPQTRASAAGLPLDGSWLCKTYRGAGGAGVWRLDDEAALRRAEQHHALFQKWVDGTSAAAVYVLSASRATLLGVTRQLVGEEITGAKPWQYCGSIGPLDAPEALTSALRRVGEVLAERFGLRGLIGVDLVVAGDEPTVIEVNPRYSASVEIVERISGAPAAAAHVAACTGVPHPLTDYRRETDTAYGKAILFAKRDVTITELFFRWAMEGSSIDPSQCLLADIPAAGEVITAGHPALTAFVAAAKDQYDTEMKAWLAEVERRLYAER